MAYTGMNDIKRFTKKTAKSKAMSGINNIRSKINSNLPATMNKASDLTGVSMPTSRAQLKSKAPNSPRIKAAAKKAVSNWKKSTTTGTIKKALKKTGTYKGQSNKLGKGGRFKQLTDRLESQGKSKKSASKIAAVVGMKKYGAKKMAKWSANERKKVK